MEHGTKNNCLKTKHIANMKDNPTNMTAVRENFIKATLTIRIE